jgi:hypothetical protein
MTRKDLLEGNKDLIEQAAEMLSSLVRHGIRVELEARGGRLPRARVVTRNVNRLDVAVNGRPRSTFEVERDAVEIELDRMVGVSEPAPLLVELRGYEGDRLAEPRPVGTATSEDRKMSKPTIRCSIRQPRCAPQLLDAPVDALKGVSSMGAKKLADAFPIERLRDLAEWKYAERARAIRAATGVPGFDPGPPTAWETFFHNAPLAHYQSHPDRFRLPFGPVYYRGRLDDTARVVVVGQDPATDEILAHRTFVGFSGQRVQGFLRKLGLTRSYVMMNTFLIGVFGQFDSELRAISLEAPILDYRNAFLTRLSDRNPVEAVIAVGGGARHAIEQWPGRDDVRLDPASGCARRGSSSLRGMKLSKFGNRGADDDGTNDLTPTVRRSPEDTRHSEVRPPFEFLTGRAEDRTRPRRRQEDRLTAPDPTGYTIAWSYRFHSAASASTFVSQPSTGHPPSPSQ